MADSFMVEFYKQLIACNKYITEVLGTLRSKDLLSNTGIVLPLEDPKSHSFRVEFPENSKISGASVAFPPDCKALEIALLGPDKKLVYIDDVGYSDVKRFSSVEDVAQELIRLSRV